MRLMVAEKEVEVKDPFLHFMDHSALKADATEADAERYAQEVLDYDLRGTCFRPHHTEIAKQCFEGTKYRNSSVLVFPTVKCPTVDEMIKNRKEAYMADGSSLADARKGLIDQALKGGANELDMIIDLKAAKDGNYATVRDDVQGAREYTARSDITLKVIECAPFFDNQQLVDITKAVLDGGADYVKTTTGFGSRAASLRDIHLFGMVLAQEGLDDVGIKAAGGIKTVDQARAAYGASQIFGTRPFIIGESSYDLKQNPLNSDNCGDSY